MPLEQFSDVAFGTVTSGGTTAPAAGTSQSWTVTTTSANAFPGASSSAVPPTVFHVADPALPSETIAVTIQSGTAWTVTRGADGTTPVAHSAGFTVYQVASAGALGMFPQVYNVRSATYGATGNGSTDDTAAIQKAINALNTVAPASGRNPGGTVYFPAGSYQISSALTLYQGINLAGDGAGAASIINQTSTTANCITGVDAGYNTFRNLILNGPSSGSGNGIAFTVSGNTGTNDSNPDMTFCDIIVQAFGGHGIYIEEPIICRFERVTSQFNGGTGFFLYGIPAGAAATSCSLISCFANNNQIGYHLQEFWYSGLHGCAADSNGLAYDIDTSTGITLNGCGAEATLAGSTGQNGCSFYLTGSSGVTLNGCMTYQNSAASFWADTGCTAITITSAAEIGPLGGAVSLKTTAGTSTTLIGYDFTSAMSLAANTVSILSDGSTGAVQLAGSLSLAQPTAAQAITASNTTITTAGLGVAPCTVNATTYTGQILQAGTVAGQTVTVVNQSAAANVIAFSTTPGTSHVADSATEPAVAGLTARRFVWDSLTSLWYRTA